MLKLLKPASPEDVFIQRYDLLMGWALGLTGRNRALAEDLVHDAFIQFTLRRSELKAIENTDAYLNRMLRNMYLSQVRRATLIQDSPISIANFDSAEIGLRNLDPRERVDVQDDLRQICQYACARKEGSKAGCVLILRFFHGYYPSEIAAILRTSRKAVDRYLLIARREAKVYVSDPGALKFTSGFTRDSAVNNGPQLGYARTTSELLAELRDTIFASRQGECSDAAHMKVVYIKPSGAVDVALLAHVVSCRHCLDSVNGLLGLPLLAERTSDDRLGRDVPPDKSGGGKGGNSGGGGSAVDSRRKYQRRLRETIEHRPQELRIAVNGFVLGAQEISSEFNKQVLSVNIDEPIGFIEVFSEQGVRLLFFDVDQPIDGSVEQTARAEFDCGRELRLSLNFRGPWPSLNVAYRDPTFEAVENPVESLDPDLDGYEAEVQSPKSRVQGPIGRVATLLERVRLHRPDFRPWTLDFGFLLRPTTITAVFALLLVFAAVLIYKRTPPTPLTAADLLQRAVVSEEAVAANRDQVLHRTLQLEEKSPLGQLLSKRRIEVWHSAQRGVTARRLYDESDQLIAGDWRRSDGVQTIYHHGKAAKLQPSLEKSSAAITFENAWQLSPSAKEFSLLIGDVSLARVDERGSTYIVSAESAKSADSPVSATLILNRNDLHPIEQTLVIRQDNETRQYRFVESAVETKPLNTVAPSVFDPEPELLSSTELETRNAKPETASRLPLTPLPPAASAALEVDVIDLLNRAGAFTGEQIDVSRITDGRLQVNALVETDKRKAELLAALASVRNNPAVRINIETVAEAQAREALKQKAGSQTQSAISVDQYTARENPVFNELRKRFSESEAQAFADRVVRRSIQARRHATALRQLSDRFSPTDLASLSVADRTRWLDLLRGHANKFLAENESLQRDLQTIFSDIGGGGGSRTLDNDREIQAAIRELYGLAVACDEDLRASFASFTNAGASAEVKTAKFWRALHTASALARSVQMAK